MSTKVVERAKMLEGVHLSIVTAEDGMLDRMPAVKEAIEKRGLRHVMVLEIDKSSPETLAMYANFKEDFRIRDHGNLLGESQTKTKITLFLMPTHESVMAMTANSLCKRADEQDIRDELNRLASPDLPPR